MYQQTKAETIKFSNDVIETQTNEVNKIKSQTSLIMTKEHELTLKMYDLEGQVEDYKLKLKAKEQ